MPGTISQGIRVASIVPRLSASGTWVSGMPTGVAPSAVSRRVICRVGPRTRMPRRSAGARTARSRLWISPGPCTCVASRCTSRNSSAAIVCTYSQYAREVAPALFMMNGSSKTSTRGKRPAVVPGSVQTMSATPSRAWSYRLAGVPPSCIAG